MSSNMLANQGKRAGKALKTAAIVEVGGVANKKVVDMIKPQLPLWAKGYADNPVFEAVVANLVSMGIHEYAGQNEKARMLADAMAQAAALKLVGSFDLAGFVDGILDKKMMEKLGVAETDSE